MTESQSIVLGWKAELRQMGWPEEAIKRCISELCEAGYRQAIDDIKARSVRDENLILAATGGAIN